MAKHYTCDSCGDTLDRTISLQDGYGELYISLPEGGWSTTVAFNIKTPEIKDVCFQCIANELIKAINNRKEVILTDQKK